MANKSEIVNHKHIVFFDGFCGFCIRSIQWLLSIDKAHKLYFAPLSGDTSKKLLDQKKLPDSLVFWSDSKVYFESKACFKILSTIGGPFKLLNFLKIIPRPLTDRAYRLVSKNRTLINGQTDQCYVPAKEIQERFLP